MEDVFLEEANTCFVTTGVTAGPDDTCPDDAGTRELTEPEGELCCPDITDPANESASLDCSEVDWIDSLDIDSVDSDDMVPVVFAQPCNAIDIMSPAKIMAIKFLK